MGAEVTSDEPVSFEQAAREVDAICDQILENDSLDPAFAALERALARFSETGHPISAIIPADAEGGLGFRLGKESTGRGFWNAYARVASKELCKPDGELHRLAKSGLAGAGGAVVTTIMTALALPAAALIVAVPMAAILVSLGVEAYCSEYGARGDESGGSKSAS